MDCVYTAFTDYLAYLGRTPTPGDRATYRLYKLATHGVRPQATYGGCVPDLLMRLARRHSLYVVPQHRIWTKAHYLAAAPNPVLKAIVRRSFFGSEVPALTLAPAVYLHLSGNHALFCQSVPRLGGLVMAVALVE